jgi:predicted SPOUT superfamily RNA methylase MTH1
MKNNTTNTTFQILRKILNYRKIPLFLETKYFDMIF